MFEKIYSETNLSLAAKRVIAKGGSPGIDGQTVEHVAPDMEVNLRRLCQELQSGSYQPKPGKREWRPKTSGSGYRPIVKPNFWDKVVQAALYNLMGPIFEPDFHEHSYGFRPGRGTLDALRRTITLLDRGYHHVVDADIQNCFNSIPHDPLMAQVNEKIRDQRVLNLIWLFLTNSVMEGSEYWTPEEGTPQGAVMSPLLCNIYLNHLDHLVAKTGFEMIRYADDFVVLCLNHREAELALALVEDWVENAGLSLHPDKTAIWEAHRDGFNFLGYRFQDNLRSPRPENIQRLKDKLWNRTRRSDYRDPEMVAVDVNRVLIGWWQHFQLSNNPQPFRELDAWIRKRISNLRSTRKGRNRYTYMKHITRKLFCLTKAFKTVQYDEGFVSSRAA